jgi:hypothetical protein
MFTFELKSRQIFYRSVNLAYAIYGYTLGSSTNDLTLQLSSVLLFLVDTVLIYKDIYHLPTLQFIRLAAVFILAPLWIYKGIQYETRLLIAFGLSFIIFDGLLYMYPKGFINGIIQ